MTFLFRDRRPRGQRDAREPWRQVLRRINHDAFLVGLKQRQRLAEQRLGQDEHRLGHITIIGIRVVAQELMEEIEREVGRLRSFRRRVVAGYGAITILLSAVWSIFREKWLSKLMNH